MSCTVNGLAGEIVDTSPFLTAAAVLEHIPQRKLWEEQGDRSQAAVAAQEPRLPENAALGDRRADGVLSD